VIRLIAPSALARLDDALIDRIRRGEALGEVLASSLAAIVIGAGAYGVAFGIWRAPEQRLYAAIKLPLLFLAAFACTTPIVAMLAMLLGARLSLAQTAVSIALSFAIGATLISWIALQLLVGSQIAWLLRPFAGRPHRAPAFTVDDPLEGGFFEELGTLASATLGAGAPIACGLALAVLALGLAWSLRARAVAVSIRREEVGLVVLGARERLVGWGAIAGARARGAGVELELAPDAALFRERIVVACSDAAAARELLRTIERERTRTQRGPFRTATA
jgi:hypothetical protein